jgi:hypothetical protein
MALSFLKGKLDITSFPIAWNDASLFADKYYWPLGPFPSIILMPFVYIFNLFNLFFYQKFLQVPLLYIIFYLCYNLARKLKYNKSDSVYLAIAFNFASVFIAIIQNSWSWQFAMVVSVFLIFLAITEYFGRKIFGYRYTTLLFQQITIGKSCLYIGSIIFKSLVTKVINLSKPNTYYYFGYRIGF